MHRVVRGVRHPRLLVDHRQPPVSVPIDRVMIEPRHRTIVDVEHETFFRLAAEVPLKITTTPYALGQANQALDDLRAGRLHGAAVLTMS